MYCKKIGVKYIPVNTLKLNTFPTPSPVNYHTEPPQSHTSIKVQQVLVRLLRRGLLGDVLGLGLGLGGGSEVEGGPVVGRWLGRLVLGLFLWLGGEAEVEGERTA